MIMIWMQWVSDWLGLPNDVTVAGNPSHWHMRRILRLHGVRVYRIRTERESGAPWWNMWRKQASVAVGRYEDIIAADILRGYGFDVRYPYEGAQYERVPRRYAIRLRQIAMQRAQMAQTPRIPLHPWPSRPPQGMRPPRAAIYRR